MRPHLPRLLFIGRNAPAAGWHLPAHSHGRYELVVPASGRERVQTPGGELVAAAGDILCFKPGVPHEEWDLGPEPLVTHYLTFECPAETGREWPLLCADVEGRVRLLAAWLFSLRDAAKPEAVAAQKAFFQALLAEFDRLITHQEDALVGKIRDYVRHHLAAPLSLDLLARHAGMSKYHFVRRYARLTGRTPMADVRLMRLAQARDMLLTGHLPVKAIASLCGFAGELAVYRLFRRHFGMTPGRLRSGARARARDGD